MFPSTTALSASPADRSLQRLAGAVLIQALEDASHGPRSCREEALAWLQGRTSSGFTFDFCCTLLDRSPQDVRLRLMRQQLLPKWDVATDTDLYAPSKRRDADKPWLQMAS
jgi:hypothetical protein